MQSQLKRNQREGSVSRAGSQGLEREDVHHSVELSRCSSAMTHQYKQMQQEYNNELSQLNFTLQEREE